MTELHEIVKDVSKGGVLHRFKNRAGVLYSAIYVGNTEMFSAPREKENAMLEYWDAIKEI